MNCNIYKSNSFLYQKATMFEKIHDPKKKKKKVVHLIITNEWFRQHTLYNDSYLTGWMTDLLTTNCLEDHTVAPLDIAYLRWLIDNRSMIHSKAVYNTLLYDLGIGELLWLQLLSKIIRHTVIADRAHVCQCQHFRTNTG